MSYKFIDEREPTDEELNSLMGEAIKKVRQKQKKAIEVFMNDLHNQIARIKQTKKHAKEA
ncbi:hypothetical protein [Thiomicrospira cyclica]|uniref:Uncharacterized protein n=1 Tax=Thiomicrospira cyclica (strain DSM 14477 / JCM 11371 / ALM1) TaxID=717773 RepID=F6DCX6_THICA|nr:hypothetical protein [Thiomicrospira cyclica]AEG31712.1 hypothetical protein Thicy_0945 [Thiomicrospira cyclica ALM1]